MNKQCVCPNCLHPACPPENAQPPYDEILHEVDNNVISVKIPKTGMKIESEADAERNIQDGAGNIDVNCVNVDGKKCKEGCTRVNVIPNQAPPPKQPGEEVFSLKTIRQIMANDDLKNTLEIEFKAPRNYVPLPDPGPPPPLIIPRQSIKQKKGKTKKK